MTAVLPLEPDADARLGNVRLDLKRLRAVVACSSDQTRLLDLLIEPVILVVGLFKLRDPRRTGPVEEQLDLMTSLPEVLGVKQSVDRPAHICRLRQQNDCEFRHGFTPFGYWLVKLSHRTPS
jgi:hypothetical protein